MEKPKLPNTYLKNKTSILNQNINRAFQAEPIKDLNRIDEIMSEFIQGELYTIEKRLNSGEILNFKDQNNQTLIHAIIRNESPKITEEKKLAIIRQLIDDKNVSLHTMTNLNQNPLHLACQKGYSLIISYLIDKDCNQTLVDNYGNTPIHYLIDKFVQECGDDDFYTQSNKQVKMSNSVDLKNINKILKNQSLLVFYELFGDNTYNEFDDTGNKIVKALKIFIKNKVQGSLPQFYELINDKIKKINGIFGDFSISQEIKLEKAKKILFSVSDEVFKIYGIDMEFSNIIWNEFLFVQHLKIKNKKTELIKSILEDIQNIENIFNSKIIKVLNKNIIEEIYSPLLKFSAGIVFLNFAILHNNFIYNKKNGKLVVVSNINFYDIICLQILNTILNILFIPQIKTILNGIGNINNIDMINTIDSNFDIIDYEYKFNYNNIDSTSYIDFIYITDNNDDEDEDEDNEDEDDNQYLFIPNELDSNKFDSNKFAILIKNINDRYYVKTKYNISKIINIAGVGAAHANAAAPANVAAPANAAVAAAPANAAVAAAHARARAAAVAADAAAAANAANNTYANARAAIRAFAAARAADVAVAAFNASHKFYIFSPIKILVETIIQYIKLIISLLKNLENDNLEFNLQKFYFFDIKYISEIIFKIINNFVILEKYLDDIKNINNINIIQVYFNEFYTQLKLNPNSNIFEYFIKQISFSTNFFKDIETKKKHRYI